VHLFFFGARPFVGLGFASVFLGVESAHAVPKVLTFRFLAAPGLTGPARDRFGFPDTTDSLIEISGALALARVIAAASAAVRDESVFA
jgi:hypothetical protein